MAYRYTFILLFTAAALLSGCAEFTPVPLSPAASAAAFNSRSLTDAGLRRHLEASLKHPFKTWPTKVWDLGLLTLAALYYHPDMALARAQHEIAQAGEITAAQRPNPTINLAPGYVTHITAAPFNPYLLTVIPNTPIETAGKRDKRITHSRHLTESARLKIAETAWMVRSRLRTSLLNLFAALTTETLRTQQVSDQEEGVLLLEERKTAGEISAPEVTLVRLSLEQSHLALREAQRQSSEAKVQLADAVGLPVAALADVKISFDVFDRVVDEKAILLGKIRRNALFSRADMLAALADYEASQSALELEIAKQYPDVQLGPGLLFNQGEYKWMQGINLPLPILNQNQGPIAEAEAKRKESATRFEALQARIIGEIEKALAGVASARLKQARADVLLAVQKKQRRSALAQYQAGETDRLALVSSRVELATTKLSRLDALIKAQQAVGLLEDAVQRPLDDLLTTL